MLWRPTPAVLLSQCQVRTLEGFISWKGGYFLLQLASCQVTWYWGPGHSTRKGKQGIPHLQPVAQALRTLPYTSSGRGLSWIRCSKYVTEISRKVAAVKSLPHPRIVVLPSAHRTATRRHPPADVHLSDLSTLYLPTPYSCLSRARVHVCTHKTLRPTRRAHASADPHVLVTGAGLVGCAGERATDWLRLPTLVGGGRGLRCGMGRRLMDKASAHLRRRRGRRSRGVLPAVPYIKAHEGHMCSRRPVRLGIKTVHVDIWRA